MNDPAVLGRIRVVLCETSHPGNIGASARAMKTMGLGTLCLVRPRFFPHADAEARAAGAIDVLQSVRVAENLDAALEGVHFACALSARRRDLTPEVVDVRAAATMLVEHARQAEAAIVFGPERTGLSIADVSRCQRLVRIGANPEYPSLNVAAAVQIVAYELRMAWAADGCCTPQGSDVTPASHEEVERLIAHLEQCMRATGFLDAERPGRLMQRMRRMLARTRPEPEEVAIVRGFLHSVDGMVNPQR